MRLLFAFIFSFAFFLGLQAQEKKVEGPDPLIGITIYYGVNLPGGDFKDDFGQGSNVDINVDWLNQKNFIFGVNGGIIWGNNVNNDVIASLRNQDSLILASNLGLAAIALKQRAWSAAAHAGKLFAFKNTRDRLGIRTTLGLGFFQHKVRIQEDFNNDIPQLSKEYIKGYDQLTNGLRIEEFIGFQYLAKNRLVNFVVGVEFSQNFTQNRRSWDFATNQKIDDARLDLLTKIKVGWTLPIYFTAQPEKLYY